MPPRTRLVLALIVGAIVVIVISTTAQMLFGRHLWLAAIDGVFFGVLGVIAYVRLKPEDVGSPSGRDER